MLHSVLDAIRSVPPALAYLIIAMLVFGEAAVFMGFALPGETPFYSAASWPARDISTSWR